MRCGCILREEEERYLITIRKTNSITRGNKKSNVDYVCTKHNIEISTLVQWIIFEGVTMNFGIFIINAYAKLMIELASKTQKPLQNYLRLIILLILLS